MKPIVFLNLLVFALLSFGMQGRCEAQSAGSEKAPLRYEKVFKEVDLQLPVWMEQLPDGTWLVVEQRGKIVRFANQPKAKKSTVLDLRDRVKYGGERGLLGLAIHPNFEKNGHIYVNYTTEKPGKLKTRISRFTSKDVGKTFSKESEKVLLSFEQPYSNHNGGQVSFGPDGYLYIGVGDGGSAGDPINAGQDKDTLLGTILRIDVDAKNKNYGIPPSNPFVKKDGRDEIYAWGLRNPWRFSWDPKTGQLWAGDVGQNAYEEIDIIQGGGNYGWRYREGKHCYKPSKGCPTKGLIDPEIEYSHDVGQSVTGGYVYRGTIEALQGKYIYADFVSGRIWAYDPERKKNEELFDTSFGIASFARDQKGELYFFDYGPGSIYKLVK